LNGKPMRRDAFIVTCEHGGNRIPAAYRGMFDGLQALLATHRGYDPGALLMAKRLATDLAAPLETSTVSRLLVDLNRSPGHPHLFSRITRAAPAEVRREIMARHYLPYRARVECRVGDAVRRGRRAVHISSHSFTPELDGHVRQADIGLLYHPDRPGEVRLCAHWKAALAALAPDLQVRRNYPYAGKGDGLTQHLRRQFPAAAYVGIELEINQRISLQPAPRWAGFRTLLLTSLRSALAATRHGET
jgi:predicted N-formylglutamate amidohydrolase